MTDKERDGRRRRILEEYARCGSIRETVRRLKTSIHVVRKVLRGQDRTKAPAQAGRRSSLLDPYRPIIQRLVAEDGLTGVLVLEEIRTLGYRGGYSILKECIRTVRPSPKIKVTTVIEHPPGAEGQVDWSPYTVTLGVDQIVVHCFSLVLPFSRFMVILFVLDEKLDTLIALHEEAFSVVGGIPKVMTYDNMTTVGRHESKETIWLNPRFEQYARERGFDVALISPGRPNEHASVERPFHYIENNCLRRRRFRFADMEDLRQHGRWWCDNVANVRVHGTTRERPCDRLLRERPLLLPLSSHRLEPCRVLTRKVGTDFCVAVETNRYSVPPKHVGQMSTIRLHDDRLEIVVAGEVAAVHAPGREQHRRYVLPEHEDAFKRVTPSRRLLEQAFLRLGPAATRFYEGLCAQRGRGAGYHLQRILKMADRHGSSVVTAALAHAARFGNYSADAVARVIAGKQMRVRGMEPGAPLPPPPERVRRWLEGMDVDSGDLADYDRIIDGRDGKGGNDDGKTR
ncbi:MAG: IS21 family transposase [bacterium]|nr:IS21 family transposase [bacterium]